MTRKGISKKIRFEVFKRDSFTCQYCGKGAPTVELNVDHIHPVAKGGTNDVLNLITSCAGCNAGKGDRVLSDNSAIRAQQNQLAELNARREQLDMMLEWRAGLDSIQQDEVSAIDMELLRLLGVRLSNEQRVEAKKWVKKYGLAECLESTALACEQYFEDAERVVAFIPKICRMRTVEKVKPYMKDLLYVRGILRKRLTDYSQHQFKVLAYIEQSFLEGVDMADLKYAALTTSRWSHFVNDIEIRRSK